MTTIEDIIDEVIKTKQLVTNTTQKVATIADVREYKSLSHEIQTLVVPYYCYRLNSIFAHMVDIRRTDNYCFLVSGVKSCHHSHLHTGAQLIATSMFIVSGIEISFSVNISHIFRHDP